MPDLFQPLSRPEWPPHYRRDWRTNGPAGVTCEACLYLSRDRKGCGWTMKLTAPAAETQCCGFYELVTDA